MISFLKEEAGYKSDVAKGLDKILNGVANMCMSSAGLAIGTTADEKVKVVNLCHYQVGGEMKSIAANTEVAFTATTDDITADADTAQERKYLLVSDGTTPSLVAGVQANEGSAEDPVESLISGKAVIGRITIVVDAGSTDFDATTNALSAGHLTVTYENIGLYLGRFSDIITY